MAQSTADTQLTFGGTPPQRSAAPCNTPWALMDLLSGPVVDMDLGKGDSGSDPRHQADFDGTVDGSLFFPNA